MQTIYSAMQAHAHIWFTGAQEDELFGKLRSIMAHLGWTFLDQEIWRVRTDYYIRSFSEDINAQAVSDQTKATIEEHLARAVCVHIATNDGEGLSCGSTIPE